eukprot:scaffold1664_cov130-Cylindrotheca_fusiformis.AAC.1
MIQDDVDDTTESNMASLEKFKPAKWVTWKLAFLNQLGGTPNGRKAWESLCRHFDGPGGTQTRINQAQQTIRDLHYRSEQHAVNFHVYSTRMTDALNTLVRDNGIVKQPSEELQHLLDGIDSTAPDYVQTAAMVISMDEACQKDYRLAVDKLSQEIAKRNKTTKGYGNGGGRKISAFNGGGRGGRGGGRGGRGSGRGGRGRGGR